MIDKERPHVFLASEIWNKKESISIHQDYASLISKPASYEGCAIFYKKELEIRPFREHFWTLNYIFAKMDRTIIISVYLNPREPEEQLETVMWYSN
jgi:exonuclease III